MTINKISNIVYIVTIATSFGSLLSFNFVNSAFSAAVPLIAIKTGDSTLNKNLHSFYSCIGKAIKSNQQKSGISSYFTHEPTRNEVIDCFNSNILHQNTAQGTGQNMHLNQKGKWEYQDEYTKKTKYPNIEYNCICHIFCNTYSDCIYWLCKCINKIH